MGKKRYRAIFSLPERSAGRGVEFKVRDDKGVIGTLIVKDSGIEWKDKGTKKKGIECNWQQLKELLENANQESEKGSRRGTKRKSTLSEKVEESKEESSQKNAR